MIARLYAAKRRECVGEFDVPPSADGTPRLVLGDEVTVVLADDHRRPDEPVLYVHGRVEILP